MLSSRDPPQNKRPIETESKGLGKNIARKWTGEKKKTGVAILISDKIEFKTKAINTDPEGQFIILKGRIPQKHMNIVNIYAPKIGASKYIGKSRRTSKKISTATQFYRGF